MRIRNLPVGLAVILAGCVRPPSPPSVPVENDKTIAFPQFFDKSPIEVGAGGELYELDGPMLQAIMIAANDRFPHSTKEQPCLDRREAHRYRVTRQGNIIFVRIDEDLDFCDLSYIISLDSGVEYAISADGRILRRIFDGEPRDLLSPTPPDAGHQENSTKPSSSQALPIPWPGEQRDGGTGVTSPAPSLPPPAVPDAG